MTSVLYLGNFRHPWCTEAHIASDLEALGHTVARLQEPSVGPDAITNRWLAKLEAQAHGYDLFLWTRTWGLPPAATDSWRRMERAGTVTASYHLDLYRGLARQENVGTDPFWTTQHVFTPDGNAVSVAWFAARGINHHWSPPAVVSHECCTVMPGTYRESLAHDVVFVGSAGWPASYHPEWPWRTDLLAWLEAMYGPRYRRYDGLSGYELTSGVHTPGPIRGQALNDLYASAKIVIGDSCFATPTQRYWSDRAFEGYGRGAYMIFPWINKLAEMIGVYPSYTVGDYDRLEEQIEYGLGDAAERKDTVKYLAAEVAVYHTYKNRLASALAKMGLA